MEGDRVDEDARIILLRYPYLIWYLVCILPILGTYQVFGTSIVFLFSQSPVTGLSFEVVGSRYCSAKDTIDFRKCINVSCL